jgi:hypothetical protein
MVYSFDKLDKYCAIVLEMSVFYLEMIGFYLRVKVLFYVT